MVEELLIKGSCKRFACIPALGGKLLLVQRRWRKDTGIREKVPDNRWSFPGVQVSEEDAEASRRSRDIIAREIKKETSLIITVIDPRPVG